MARANDERIRQIATGAGILLAITVVLCTALLGWMYLPGLLGEWVGMIIGILTTPFFLEASFLLLGLIIVISLNTWHRHKNGDDCVYLEQVTGPDVPDDLPDQARWAIFRDHPLDATAPTPLELAEGALATGDHDAAAQWIATMDPEMLHQPDVLRLRLELARASGHHDLATRLEREIHENP
jgi:hypothetical protein